MAKSGPKVKTAATRRKSKAPPPSAGRFRPDPGLDACAREEFVRLVGGLERAGTLDRVDPRLVDLAARTYSRLMLAEADVAREGMTLKASNGTAMPHPMLGQINSMTMRLCRLLGDMGLTAPSSKHGVPPQAETEGEKPADGWGDLLSVVG